MKAIRTTWHPPTVARAAYIKAADGDNNYVKASADQGDSSYETHKLAALELCSKMEWGGQIEGGYYKGSWYWVFLA